jgi:hypothetical protein
MCGVAYQRRDIRPHGWFSLASVHVAASIIYSAAMLRHLLRNRTAAELRKQAAELREATSLEPSPEKAEKLIRLAERYEALAAEREEEP